MQPATYTIRQHNKQFITRKTMPATPTPAPIRIPKLPSWIKEGSKYTLFRAGLGYLHIRPAATGYTLTVRPDLDGVQVGDPQILAQGGSPEFLVTRAQQLYTTEHDKGSTF